MLVVFTGAYAILAVICAVQFIIRPMARGSAIRRDRRVDLQREVADLRSLVLARIADTSEYQRQISADLAESRGTLGSIDARLHSVEEGVDYLRRSAEEEAFDRLFGSAAPSTSEL